VEGETVEIEVIPERLDRAAATVRALGHELENLRGSLAGAVTGLPGACGFPDAAAAGTGMNQAWTGALERLATTVNVLGETIAAARALYVATDQHAMPPASAGSLTSEAVTGPSPDPQATAPATDPPASVAGDVAGEPPTATSGGRL
jgi:Excreted virulence factor EspC, type VII ESX diderm